MSGEGFPDKEIPALGKVVREEFRGIPVELSVMGEGTGGNQEDAQGMATTLVTP